MIQSREMLIAVPGSTDDVYLRHQQVWSAVAPFVTSGQEFLYRHESPRLVRVRCASLPSRATVVAMQEGPMLLDLVTSDRYDRNKERDVAPMDVVDWSARLLHANGFVVRNIEVLQYAIVRGVKPRSATERRHLIRYATSTLRLDLAVRSKLDAQHAWINGVGRGRRFGFGMLASTRAA